MGSADTNGIEDEATGFDDNEGAGIDQDDLTDSEYIINDEDYAVSVPPIQTDLQQDQFLEDDGYYGINHLCHA